MFYVKPLFDAAIIYFMLWTVHTSYSCQKRLIPVLSYCWKQGGRGFFERWGIYFRICFLKDIGLISILNSQTAHCIASLLSRRVLSVFHVSVYSSRPQRVGWGGAPWFSPTHTLSEATPTGASFKPILPRNREFRKVWMCMSSYAVKKCNEERIQVQNLIWEVQE